MDLIRTPTTLLQLQADDGRHLDALLYESADAEPDVAVLHLHGKGSSFLGGPGRFVPPRWPGVTHLALNMRCRDLAYTRMDLPSPDFTRGMVPVGGGYWESIADGHRDVAAAVEFLRATGSTKIFIAGHSSGGFYTADYCARDNDIAGRILISPLTANRTALPVWFDNEDDMAATLDHAQGLVADGRGERLIVLTPWYYAISAASLLERAAEPDGVWLAAMNRSPSPVLLMWGREESRHAHWHEQFEALKLENKSEVVIDGAEHNFVGYEAEVTASMHRFVDEVVRS